MRVLHFSDIHVSTSFADVPLKEFLGKRLVGLGNLTVRRGKKFAEAAHKVGRLAEFLNEVGADVALCTGDYTALGTEPELHNARRVIQGFVDAPLAFITVPGNHDLYMPDTVADGRFERHFGDLLKTDLPAYQSDGPWPTVRLLGDEVAIVCVNSARPNPQPWLSSGRISATQLDALGDILADERVRDRFIIVATHYAPRLENGEPDSPRHGLENADELLARCATIERGFIAHGHVHWCYEVRVPELRVPMFGAGSATHQGREGIWVYDINVDGAYATRGGWSGDGYQLDPATRRPI